MRSLVAFRSERAARMLGAESRFSGNDDTFGEVETKDWPMPASRQFRELEERINREEVKPELRQPIDLRNLDRAVNDRRERGAMA